MNLNAVDIGAAYLPQNQDPTLGPSTVPGANAYTTNLLRPYRGLGNINQNTTEFHDTYHSMQVIFNRRFRDGFAFGAELHLEHLVDGQHRPAASGCSTRRTARSRFAPIRPSTRSCSSNLDDAAARPQGERGVGHCRSAPQSFGAHRCGCILNDWQISGVLTAGSGDRYDLSYTLPGQRREREPDRIAGLRRADRLHRAIRAAAARATSTRSSTRAAVTGPTYGSVGLESGRNILRGCADKTVDLALVRNIRVGGARQLSVPARRVQCLQRDRHQRPSEPDSVQQPDRPDDPQSAVVPQRGIRAAPGQRGRVNSARLEPKDAGLRAATGAQNMRNLQLQIRFQF